MADFKISGKNVITQAGSAEPVLASNVTLGTGIIKSANITDAATSTLSCTTDSTITVATADSSSLSVGMAVSGTNIPANAHIITIPNATSFTITSAATGGATSTLTFNAGITSAKIEDDAVTYAKLQNLGTANRVLGSSSTGVIGEVQIAENMIATDAVTATKIATGAVVADGLGAAAVTSTALHADVTGGGAVVTGVKPHIIPGKLYPAVAGKLLDGSTSHSGAYGTAQADGFKYFWTEIKGSKPIKDPRIGAHFGSQRHKFKSLQVLEQESAAHGYTVWSLDGRQHMRVWTAQAGASMVIHNDTRGNGIRGSTASMTWAMEITGYFSAANILCYQNATTHMNSCDIQIDGVTMSNNINYGTAVNTPLEGRYVDCYSLVALNTGATTLGLHTLRFWSDNTGGNAGDFGGIELIAQDTTSTATKSQIQIPSQNVVSYGKKFTVAGTPHYNPFAQNQAGSAIAIGNTTSHGSVATGWAGTGAGYFDDTLDTATSLGLTAWVQNTKYYRPVNGGRVVKWVDSSGNIKTSVTMMPPAGMSFGTSSDTNTPEANNWSTVFSPLFSTTTADNSLTETVKHYEFLEFGNGSANGNVTYKDWGYSMGNTTHVYIMDDGLTGMAGKSVSLYGLDMYGDSGGEYVMYSFIGTGIVIRNKQDGGGTRTFAQNLPYGSHILKRTITSGGTSVDLLDGVNVGGPNNYIEVIDWWIQQPKMPPIPEDAVVIADYMLMADHVVQTDCEPTQISKGVRYINGSRDHHYNAASIAENVLIRTGGGEPIGGFSGCTTASADLTVTLPFFGTNAQALVQSSEGDYEVKLGGVTKTDTPLDSSDHPHQDMLVLADSQKVALGQTYLTVISRATDKTFSGSAVASPIHTSSHYQTFETPFLHELVGGDRNMEQTNLVVTPDGKTWDQVTRDTSYIGNMLVGASHNNSYNADGDVNIWDYWRGAGSYFRSYHNKDFAIAYNKVVCLVPGQYQVIVRVYEDSAGQIAELFVNGTHVSRSHSADTTGSTHNSMQVQLKRGDYVQVKGRSLSYINYNFLTISRV